MNRVALVDRRNFSLMSCSIPPTQQDADMVICGVLGGVRESQVGKAHGKTAAILVGTLAGATIGGAVGKSLDDTDLLYMLRGGIDRARRKPSAVQ